MDKTIILDDIKTAHQKSWNKAKKEMPALDLVELIELLTKVTKKQISVYDAAKALSVKYQKPIEIYLDTFAHIEVELVLKHSDIEFVEKLGNKKFVNQVFKAKDEISKLVKEFSNGEINEIEFINSLSKTKLKDISSDILNALDIDTNKIQDALSKGPVIGYLMLSQMALTEAYTILMEAKEDARIAHELRLEIEEECNKSIELMRNYRIEMNEVVSNYLCNYLETFEIGIEAMDQAILDNDINGYIKGNNLIQEILNYNIQFKNEDEFDELTNSDIAFKL